MLSVRGAVKNFGGVRALDGCSLEVDGAGIYALIGPNGSGKTTLFNAISRLVPLEGGSIFFDGRDLGGLSDFEVGRCGISRTFQEVRLFDNLTVGDHILLSSSRSDEGLLRGLAGGGRAEDGHVRDVLKMVNLYKPADTPVTSMSYGERKLLSLGVAIALPHRMLMLDEPVAGVNSRLRGEIRELMLRLREKGETVFLIEHDMDFVMGMADRVFVMNEGRIIASGLPRDVKGDKRVLEAYLGG